MCRTRRTDAGRNPRRRATGGGSPSESANGPARVARLVLVRLEHAKLGRRGSVTTVAAFCMREP